MTENYTILKINPGIKILRVYGYSHFKWHYKYWGNGELEILNIPDGTQIHIKGYYKECWCWASKKYLALRKDRKLYNLDI